MTIQSPSNQPPNEGDIVYNEHGAGQSYIAARCDLLPGETMLDLARVLGEGAVKYGDYSWHRISADDHINHAMTHVFNHMTGDTTEEHLLHALCRLMMAYEKTYYLEEPTDGI